MRITTLLDPEVNLISLVSRTGDPVDWFDSHVIDALRSLGHTISIAKFQYDINAITTRIVESRPDIVFNLMTPGQYGDGRDVAAVSLLDLLGLRYTGPGQTGLILARDKAVSKRILRDAGVAVPDFVVCRRGQISIKKSITFPVIVKPLASGGARGLSLRSLVSNRRALESRVKFIHRTMVQPAICERFVSGREFTVGLIGGPHAEVLPVYEWHFPRRVGRAPTFFTDRAKWDEKYRKQHDILSSRPKLPPALDREVKRVAKLAFRLLELRHYANVDLRVDDDEIVHFIEANAKPGLCPNSGRFGTIPFNELIKRIVSLACRSA